MNTTSKQYSEACTKTIAAVLCSVCGAVRLGSRDISEEVAGEEVNEWMG